MAPGIFNAEIATVLISESDGLVPMYVRLMKTGRVKIANGISFWTATPISIL
jgi:hypothetical protein